MQRKATVTETTLDINYNDSPITTQRELDSYKFEFDESWLGFEKTAIFYADKANVKHLVIPEDGVVTIPWEVLVGKPLILYVGVFGTKGSTVKPTTISAVRLREGSYIDGTIPMPPTPDVYNQILNAWTDAKAAEVIRADNEIARLAEEIIRSDNEIARIDAEIVRATAAGLMKAAEDLRATAEGLRTTGEIARSNAEALRVTTEDLRKSEETTRAGFYAGFNTQLAAKAPQSTTYTKTEVDNKDTGIITQLAEHKLDYTSQRQQDQLKLATVEKGLNDYKSTLANVNANQEAKQKVTGYGTISLPKNTANGQVSVSVKGNTFSQFLSYNQQDYDKWLVYGTTTKSTNGFSFSNTAYANRIELVIPTDAFIKDNGRYIIIYKALSTSSIIVTTSGGSTPTNIATVVGFNKAIIQFDGTVDIRFRLWANGINTLSDIRLIESTSNAENDFNSMTADQFSQKYSFINGTKSTISTSRLKSVGKNLFDWKTVKDVSNTVLSTYRLFEFNLKPNTDYTIHNYSNMASLQGITVAIWNGTNYADSNRIPILSAGAFYPKTTIKSNALGKLYLAIHDSTEQTWRNVLNYLIDAQLEQGMTATPYEPYSESTQYLPNVGELRSLPNGVKDEVRVSGGVAEYIKRVETFIVNGSGTWTVRQYGIDLNAYYADILINDAVKASIALNSTAYGSQGNLSLKNMIDTDPTSVDQYFINNKRVWISIPKGQIPSTYLVNNPITLTYQLAEPIITPINVSGNLISYPSGTVYVENVVADAGNYTTKFDIKKLQLSIKSIDKLIKYNFATGVQTVLDTNLAVISGDKKSFTHPNLANKDMVFVDYFCDVESTLGETTIEYLDSRHTIKDTTNNKFYKWNIKSTNGVPTVNLTEVL